mgnify:CR=1 FL=1
MRGRKPGQGKFIGGRPKTSPNKKGSFETSLPPVRCSEALKSYYQQKAQAAGQELSTYLRQVLSSLKQSEEATTDNKSLHGTQEGGAKNCVEFRLGLPAFLRP